MPARTRRSAGATTTSDGGHAVEASSSPAPAQGMGTSPEFALNSSQATSSRLKFNQPLTWRAGRPILVAELLKRLQSLANELKDIDQDDDDSIKASLAGIAKELADQQLLGHKDQGVKAWVARSAVEVLRLCAPDAPFTSKQLRGIFEMIIKFILPALSDPSQPYNNQHTEILHSLAQVKSIILVTDVPNADNLITQIFTTFFDIVSGSSKSSTGEQISKGVHFNMTSALVILVDEAQTLPQDAVDIVVAQFLRVDPRVTSAADTKIKKGAVDTSQATLALKELPPAYLMAKTICLSCQEKMAREISKYFNDVIIDASGISLDRGESGDIDDVDNSLNEDNLRELDKAHRLLRELWRACPVVLQNVIPQLEAELAAENVQLRVLATETLGDIASGIGAAGPPPPPVVDPASYPPLDLSAPEPNAIQNPLTKPSSPQSFAQVYTRAYNAFMNRKKDKSALVRSSWATAVGRILATSAGGMGLAQDEELRLVEDMARMLNDSDEKVRLAAVQAIGYFAIKDIINKIGLSGSVDKPGSVLGNLSERVKDRKSTVRTEAMFVFARIWAAAFGEVSSGNESVKDLVGGIPSKILNTYYTNDPEIIVMMDKVLFEILLPLQYPPTKSKQAKQASGSSQRVKDSQEQAHGEATVYEPEKIRTERILLLVQGLDERAKRIFFALSQRQVSMTKCIQLFLKYCEEYNGGVMDSNEDETKNRLNKIINELAKFFPDAAKVSADLWKFAKTHDRRAYQLMRFCYAPESDFKTVNNAIKEFSKRIDSNIKDTMLPLLYRISIILYNRSHVPAILEFSRSNDSGLSSIAHEILTDISSRIPEVLKAQVREICMKLQEDAPSATRSNSPDAVNDLKACASFAKKFPSEIPQDRKFTQAMTDFASFGSPPEAAKHAVSIVMLTSNKKEMRANDIGKACKKELDYGKPGFLARLAALSQLCLMTPGGHRDANALGQYAIEDLLKKHRTPPTEISSRYQWSSQETEECTAKCWAVRLLVNQLRSNPKASSSDSFIPAVFQLLNNLIEWEGALAPNGDTPGHDRSRLRLLAARSLLKICQTKELNAMFMPRAFCKLAEVAQDNIIEVRGPFLARLKKYLSKNTLPARFYTIPFLLAYEPVTAFKVETVTWLKSRASFLASYQEPSSSTTNGVDARATPKVNTVLENVFSRLLSLLAHHPDYEDEAPELIEMSQYIVFYLSTVASDKNISLIYHIAQRVKSSKDKILTDTPSEKDIKYTHRLHSLSDLATYTIRTYLETRNWSLQSLPAGISSQISLPGSLFGALDHDRSMSTATQDFLLEGVEAGVDDIVKRSLRKGGSIALPNKKRKSESEGAGSLPKKAKSSTLPTREKEKQRPRKASKRKAHDWNVGSDGDEEDGEKSRTKTKVNGAGRRKSGRATIVAGEKSYRERDDSEDDAEMEEANDGEEMEDDEDDEVEEDKEAENGDEEDSNVNGAEDTNMVDDEADQQEEAEEVVSPPKPGSRKRSAAASSAATTPKRASGRVPRSSNLSSSPTEVVSAAKSKPTQTSKTQPKGKKAAPIPPAIKAGGRITRSKA